MLVHKKLMQARIRLHQQKLKKSGWNGFSEYAYFELGDFLIPSLSIFAELGLCAVTSFTSEVATMTITDTDSGSEIIITSPMGSANLKGCHIVQNIGAVETYQRRYLWTTAMEIAEHDALDASMSEAEEADKKPAELIDLRPLLEGIKSTKTDEDAVIYWRKHLPTLAGQKADYETFKAAVVDHRMTLKAATVEQPAKTGAALLQSKK